MYNSRHDLVRARSFPEQWLLTEPSVASHSRGTKPPCWRARVTALGQTKGIHSNFEMVISFVCLVPVLLLLSSMAILYHVNG